MQKIKTPKIRIDAHCNDIVNNAQKSLESKVEETQATYVCSVKYIDDEKDEHEATVYLRIDFKNGTYEIKPPDGDKASFQFIDRYSCNSRTWIAVLFAIQKAIAYAENCLGYHKMING